MIQSILFLVISLVLIIGGSNYLIEGGASVAKRCGISEFIIGALIIGFGTSCPELVVSMTGALSHNPDIAIGNIIGSNIFNTAFILGLTSLLVPITVTERNKRFDISCLTVTTLLLLLSFCVIGKFTLTRWEGLFFILVFGVYIFLLLKGNDTTNDSENTKVYSLWLSIVFIVGGLVALIFGGRLFVRSGVEIARYIGVSDKFIAMTVLAIGTSLPEACTCIISALKGKSQMALGDIIGSNIFNILLILGSASVIYPLSFSSIKIIDFVVLILTICILKLGKSKLSWKEGILFLLLFTGYYGWMVFNTIQG